MLSFNAAGEKIFDPQQLAHIRSEIYRRLTEGEAAPAEKSPES